MTVTLAPLQRVHSRKHSATPSRCCSTRSPPHKRPRPSNPTAVTPVRFQDVRPCTRFATRYCLARARLRASNPSSISPAPPQGDPVRMRHSDTYNHPHGHPRPSDPQERSSCTTPRCPLLHARHRGSQPSSRTCAAVSPHNRNSCTIPK